MSIIASNGKIRKQINQGALKHEGSYGIDWLSNLDPAILEKIALITPTNVVDQPKNDQNQDLQSAMDSGNMRGNNLPDEPDNGMNGEMGEGMPSAQSVQPNNPQQQGMSPFLSPSNTDENAGADEIGLQQEKIKLRQAAGQGFALNLKRTQDGSFELVIQPPQGYTIQQPDQFTESLMKSVGGEAEEIGDPDPRSGVMKIVYKSQLAAQKVMKSKKTKR